MYEYSKRIEKILNSGTVNQIPKDESVVLAYLMAKMEDCPRVKEFIIPAVFSKELVMTALDRIKKDDENFSIKEINDGKSYSISGF